MGKRSLQIACLVLFSLSACQSAPVVVAPTVVRPTMAVTETVRPSVSITATDIQLPYNLVESDSSYCQPPYAFLPNHEAAGLSDDEIAFELVRLWLSRYEKAEAHPYCRIDGYILNDVYFDEYTSLLPLEPKGDFMRMADFSIKLIQVPNLWLSLSGNLDQNNWFHLKHAIVITKVEGGYRLEFAHP